MLNVQLPIGKFDMAGDTGLASSRKNSSERNHLQSKVSLSALSQSHFKLTNVFAVAGGQHDQE